MTIQLSIHYPPLKAEIGLKIKGDLQEEDILADFGPGQSLWSHLFGGKSPDMTNCTIIEPNWFENNFEGASSPAPLTTEGAKNLLKTLTTIYQNAGGPLTLRCHKPDEIKANEQQLALNTFASKLEKEGLSYNTLFILT